jgi:gliding motility-associated-like protein
LFTNNTYQWSFGDGNTSTIENPIHSFAGNNNGYLVTLTALSERGCRDTTSKLVNVPLINFTAGRDTFVLKNTIVQLNAGVANTFTWTPTTYMNNGNISNPTLIFPDTGIYSYFVEGTTKEGCYASDSITITVAKDLLFVVPNAFSPNDDGLNDFLMVLQAGYKELKYFRIFDRWGKALFYTTKFSTAWDGTYLNKKCEQGVYYWMASGIDIFGNTKVIKGDVTLFR